MIFVMATKNISKNKKNGIYYTPKSLAEFLVKPLIKKGNISILDPAYGEGALLLAAESAFQKKMKSQNKHLNLFGCDKEPVNGLLKHIPSSQLLKIDFLNFPFEHKFDVILMNPPFVRYPNIGTQKIEEYQNITTQIFKAKTRSDLWVYFLIKSIGHLKNSGSIGAILPWSFLQANYSRDLRAWLTEQFEEIKILALGSQYFDKAAERILLVWLHNYRYQSNSIKICFSKNITNDLIYSNIDKKQFESPIVAVSKNYNVDKILEKYVNNHSFNKFKKFADIKIGVVTGANDFFIRTNEDANKLGFSKDHLIPVFTSSKEFLGLYTNGNIPSKSLLTISKKSYEDYKEYINHGMDLDYHLRVHSTLRDPWYSLNIGITPDAFFPYRMARIPFLMINDHYAQCTNSIHRVYFKELSANEKKWIQVSLLSVPGQLSLERYSKIYGSGVLKIEPNSLKNSIVYKNNDNDIKSIYYKLSELISKNSKHDAMMMATDFINNKLKIPRSLSNDALSALNEFQTRRLNR